MSPVAQRLDLARQAVLFLDGDPLEHLEPLPKLADFVAQALVLGLGLGFEPLIAAVTPAAPADRGPDDRCHHDDRNDRHHHDLTAFHYALSSTSILSRSRSASICAAVSAPRSVTIRSSTLMRSWSCFTWDRSRAFSASFTGSPRISRIERTGMPILCRMMVKAKTRMRMPRSNSKTFIAPVPRLR